MSISDHLEKLKQFSLIAENRSINSTAMMTGLSQSGLSKSLSILEGALEVKLFVRSSSGLELTKEGQSTLEFAHKILADSLLFEANLRSSQQIARPKSLRIGMYDSIAVYLFATVTRYFSVLFPELRLLLTVASSAELANRVCKDQLDLAIGVNLRGVDEDSQSSLLFKDSFSFYTASNIKSSSTLLPFIIHPDAADGNGRYVSQYLKDAISKQGAHFVHNFETLKILTLQGLGIGVLPTQVARPLLNSNQLVPVRVGKAKSVFGLHEINLLASAEFTRTHGDFTNELVRLGTQWTKNL